MCAVAQGAALMSEFSPNPTASTVRSRHATLAVGFAALAVLFASTGIARGDDLATLKTTEPDFDVRLHGVALVDFGTPLADALDVYLRVTPPKPLVAIHRVVMGPIETGPDADVDAEECRPARWLFDVIGTTDAAYAQRPRSRARGGRVGEEKPGSRGHIPATHVVRVALELPDPSTRCPMPSSPTVRVIETFEVADLRPSIHVSTSDQVVLVEDVTRNFRRIFPAGVGAIDRIRAPGQVTSLTPATSGSRIHPHSSFKTLGAPRWFKGEPFLPIEAPMPVGNRVGFYTTRVAFHIYQTYRFMRAYISRGCVTLRTGDLREIRDALFSRTDGVPVYVQSEPMPEVFHPFPHETDLYFRLKPFGPKDKPTFRVSGGLYVTEKVKAAPPVGRDLVDVFLDAEVRLRQRSALAGEPRTQGNRL